jgi:PAS domain S-box-containing protein
VSKTTPSSLNDAPVFSTELLEAVVDLCPLGLMLSSNRKIVTCNTRFASMFGYLPTELLGKDLVILYPSIHEYQRIGERGWQAMQQKGEYQDERLMRKRDGLTQWFRVHGNTSDLTDPFGNACWVFEPLHAGADVSRLTPREREVLAGMSRGQTAKEAAKELGLSPRTVEKIRAGLRAKFGTHNAAELMSRVSGLPH